MKALTWHGRRDVRYETVPDPQLRRPTDAIVRVTSSGLCGSDLHLYEVLGPFMAPGDILGHEPMGIVEEVAEEVTHVGPGDRVVVPFNIACGACFMCERGLQSQCETTQVRAEGKGAALLGYTRLYGRVAGGQAEYLRVPQAHYGLVPVPEGPPDDRFLFLSDVLPTAWQAVEYADVPNGGTLLVIGLGPIGEMACRVARHRGVERILGIEPVAERRSRAAALGVTVYEPDHATPEAIGEATGGRGPDSVIDAVGMEAHGAPMTAVAHRLSGLLPRAMAAPILERAGIDRLSALHLAIDLVRRGGTISIVGVYGGMLDPMPMLTLFDKQPTVRMGQANVRRWIDDLMPLVTDDADPLGTEAFASHHVPLRDGPDAYARFQAKEDGTFKVVFTP